jgi:hypothetical protein
MATFKSLADFYSQLEKLGKDLTGPEKRKITRDMAKQAQRIAAKAADADIGGSFSGWNRGKPIELATQVRAGREFSAILTPTKSSAGPWTVAEKGRNQGNAGGFSGPGVNRRTGVTSRTASGALRKVRTTKARRWNGTTVGKKTASEATAAMEREIPKVAHKGVLAVTRKHFDVT